MHPEQIHQAIGEAYASANIMQSDEANFEANTWTFTAPYFKAGAGEYIIIHRRDWEGLMQKLRDALTESSAQEK
jgi:hypothetical protein